MLLIHNDIHINADIFSGVECREPCPLSLTMESVGKSCLETPLRPIQYRNQEFDGQTSEQCCCRREDIVEEAKKQLWLAGPLIAVSLLQYSLQMISIMFVGHLGNLPLSGASLGSSFASVTGYSVLVSGFCSISLDILDLSQQYLINPKCKRNWFKTWGMVKLFIS